MSNPKPKIINFLATAVVVLFILLPFHAFFTTWLGATFGYIDVWRIWKEALLIFLCLGVVGLIVRQSRLREVLRQERLLVGLILLYGVLFLGYGLVALALDRVSMPALLFSWFSNLRFVVFFVAVWLLTVQTQWLRKIWPALLLGPASLVIVFGLLQQFVLPANILSHVGYGPETIPAYQTVDQKPDFIRIQSTLRGPNPLGAYLVLIGTAAIVLWLAQKKNRSLGSGFYTVASVLLLVFTYSRSAWLGAIASFGLIIWWAFSRYFAWRWLLLVVGVMGLLGGDLLWTLRNNNLVQNTIFHTDETSPAPVSSNKARIESLKNGLHDVVNEPLGRGPGTAGPASLRNYPPSRIAENYYLQIGQEIGIIGLGLFVVINVAVVLRLWLRRTNPLALVLLFSFAGLTVINMVSHAWTDDTLSLLWWGLAGIALAPAILKSKRTKHEKTQEETS